MNSDYPRIDIAGENSSIVYFSERPCSTTSSMITHTANYLKTALADQLIDLVPSYTSLLVIYNPLLTDHQRICKAILHGADERPRDTGTQAGRIIQLPVYYSVESGPDLSTLAENAGLTIDEVITLHQQTEYLVYAIGFAPGFAYLGEVDPRIAAPRLATPRQKVPRGAVAIADRQTAVYPAQSPGGWNLIGLCPTIMFDPDKQPITPVEVGDRVRFNAISREQFLKLGGSITALTEKAQ